MEEVRLQGNILHLDCAMSLVREGLMIVCEDSFADGIPETFKDWDRITVAEKDAEDLAINGLPISPEVYVTDAADSFAAHGCVPRYPHDSADFDPMNALWLRSGHAALAAGPCWRPVRTADRQAWPESGLQLHPSSNNGKLTVRKRASETELFHCFFGSCCWKMPVK